MRCLIFNTKEIKFGIGKGSSRPVGIKPIITDDDYLTFYNVAVVLLCIEADDDENDSSLIVDELVSYSKMVKRKLLVVPFVHLSYNISTNSELPKSTIKNISRMLKERNILEGSVGFGFNRSMIAKWITLDHEGSVAFRDSKYLKAI